MPLYSIGTWDTEWGHYGNDTSVLIERTDGMTEEEILESWKR